MKKNDFIELCRFVACIIIFSYHAGGTFQSGWIFVEYFFFLSGYFLMRHWWKRKDEISEPGKFPIVYTVNKFARFWPYIIISMVAYWGLTIYQSQMSGKEVIRWLLHLPENLLLLNGTGVVMEGVQISENVATPAIMIGAMWYLAAMFVATPIVLYLLQYGWKKIGFWLITFLPFILYGNMILRDGTINGWHRDMMQFFTLDTRALAGLLLGCAVFVVAEKLRKIEFTKAGKMLLTFIELACLVVAVLITTISLSEMTFDILVILLFLVSLSITTSGQSQTSKIRCRFFAFLGGISLPIYCIHYVVIKAFNDSGHDMYTGNYQWMALIVTVVIALIIYFIVEKTREARKRGRKKFMKLLVVKK